MPEKSDGQAGTILMAFVLGAIAGAATALLWAPAAGADTRRKLGDRARDNLSTVVDKGKQAYEKGKDAYEKSKDKSKDALERGKEAFEQARGPKEPA